MEEPFAEGERALLVDERGRRYLIALEKGGTFHHHRGALAHDEIIGAEEGSVLRTSTGSSLSCFRPRLADFVLKMSRGAQVIYPKDLGAIVVFADVHPGAHVLEAGTGSGALTMALCRAVGERGRLVSYETREPFHEVAGRNLEDFFGTVPPWVELRLGDVRAVASTPERFDRVLLDLPEPWGVLDEVAGALRTGGIACAYLPTTVQVQQLVLALGQRGFAETQTFELLLRSWHVTGRSVRPDHRMVAHTGFITIARKTLA